MEMRLWLFMT